MYYLELNKIYHIQCVTPFSTLDGVYEVVQKKTYAELIRDGIDMVADCYEKVNLTADDWEADAVNMQQDTFYKLEYPSDQLIRPHIWLPDSKIASYPDSNIFRYKKLMLMVNLGIFDNADGLTSAMTTIKNLLSTNLGIDCDPRATAYEDIWLSAPQYEAIEDARDTLRGTVINYISENNRLVNDLNKANARIAALEDLVAALDNQP